MSAEDLLRLRVLDPKRDIRPENLLHTGLSMAKYVEPYSDELQKLRTTLRLVSSGPFLDNGATRRIRFSGLLLR